jgi:hypothetical protein
MAAATAVAFSGPVASRMMLRASRIVAIPIVIARSGTDAGSGKLRASAMRVASSSLISRVRDAKSEPGSLKAMWPLAPMPAS